MAELDTWSNMYDPLRKQHVQPVQQVQTIQQPGPQFVYGQAPGYDAIARDAVKTYDQIRNGIYNTGALGSAFLSKLGRGFDNIVHDDVFPTKERQAQLREMQRQNYFNNGTYDAIARMNGIDPTRLQNNISAQQQLLDLEGVNQEDNRTVQQQLLDLENNRRRY
jgi:hypothetical protein